MQNAWGADLCTHHLLFIRALCTGICMKSQIMVSKLKKKTLKEVLKELKRDSSDSDSNCHSGLDSFLLVEVAAYKDGSVGLMSLNFLYFLCT